ncbi:hypothetical protein [Labrenzia sp. VG12]|uniref:hypothetical protein n=1 Tax=Labrenzia sp. VG12 TaxID=2021862 RepID=UPI0012FE09ED|nr:hypothetical protein [Labrenzia sp. VG12]
MTFKIDERVVIPVKLDTGKVSEILAEKIYKVLRDTNGEEGNFEEGDLEKIPMEKKRVHFQGFYCIMFTFERAGTHYLSLQAYTNSGSRIRG